MNVRYDMVAVHVLRQIDRRWELLQLKRTQSDYMGGTWQTVRGTSNQGERAWQAALRELREETSLVPTEFYKLSLTEVFYLTHDETIWHCPAFCAIVAPKTLVQLNEEHEDYRWIDFDSAEQHVMWPGEHEAIKEIRREIINDGLSKSYLRIKL